MTPRSELHGGLKRLLAPAYFGLLAVIIFGTQFAGTGFDVSNRHYGQASSHALAIASRATPVNGFVGHAENILNTDGAMDYNDFDQHPVFFSALPGALIGLTEDLATKVWIARQVMNVIFLLTMLLAWLLLRRLGLGRRLALAGVTLGFSGYMLLYYRELIHFDQPALAGMMLLLYVIARVKQEGREGWRWLTIAALLAVSSGRGIVSLSVLGLWAAIEAAGLLWQRERPLAQRLQAIARHDATRVLLLAVAWLTLMLGYNLAHEMARRGVSLNETGIVESMSRRLPGGEAEAGWTPDYDEFATVMERRLLRWFLPLDERSGQVIHQWALLPALLLIVHYLRHQPPARRIALLLTACSGIAWLFVMINLAWFHDYTTMHALGFALVFWLALLARVRERHLINALLLLSLALFLRAALEAKASNSSQAHAAALSDDYERILQRTGRSGKVIFSDPATQHPAVNAARYALGFYLGDNVLATSPDGADYMVAGRRHVVLPGADGRDGLRLLYTLTPENRGGFLLDLRGDAAYAPADIAPRHNFGGELALGQWELRDSVQVRPCQRVRVESWWQASAPPQANYALQLSLTDEGGGFLASADSAPLSGDTRDWIAGGWYPDGRVLQIPCDAAAGAYSLILSVYDPDSNAASDKLALINADGSEGATWLYLTTLYVN